MNVEMILRQVPLFKDLVMDTILFESKYPVLFTCKNGSDIYLFSCCLVNAKCIKWIATKTNYDTLIQLLQDKITIRESFLDVTEEIIVVEYDGNDVHYEVLKNGLVPSELLPTAGEYMDVEDDEFAEEIAVFESRNKNFEYKISPRINNFYIFTYRDEKITLSDEYFNTDFISGNETIFGIKKISDRSVAYA